MAQTNKKNDDQLLKQPSNPEFISTSIATTPKAMYVVYAAILIYGILCQIWFDIPFYAMYLWYIVGMVDFIIWHWCAHQKWTKDMYRYHMKHHYIHYPPSYFFGNPKVKKELLENNWYDYIPLFRPESFWHELPLYLIGLTSVGIAYALGVSVISIKCGIFEMAVIGFVGNYFHNSFHVKGHWLEDFDWYHQIRALHYLHHQGSAKNNLAILNFRLDKILGWFDEGHEHTDEKIEQDAKPCDHDKTPLDPKTLKYVKQYENVSSSDHHHHKHSKMLFGHH